MSEEPFLYMETYDPPPGQGYTRYASATLERTDDRRFWANGDHRWVMDDFDFLKSIRQEFRQ